MRVLIAEDTLVVRRVLRHMVESVGHEVEAFENGRDAWRAFRKEAFDVVITDWAMPELDGMGLVRRIRRLRRRTYPWIIMLTARDFEENVEHTVAAGVDDYLVKPVNPQILRVRLQVAERVTQLTRNLILLEDCIPVCMHCRNVREGGDWQQLDRYLAERAGVSFSHCLCPDCYYTHSLRPDLTAHRRVEPSTSFTDPVDPSVIEDLRRLDADDCPGILDEIVASFQDVAARVYGEVIPHLRGRAVVDAQTAERLSHFAMRARDLGAVRLEQRVAAACEAGRRAQLVPDLLDRMSDELDAVRRTLAEVTGSGAVEHSVCAR